MTTTTRQNVLCDANGNPIFPTLPVVASAAGSFTLVAADSGVVRVTSGNTVQQVVTLPAAVAGLNFTFINTDTDGVNIVAAGGDGIAVRGVSYSSISSVDAYASITLVAIDSTNWVITSVTHKWTTSTGAIFGYMFNVDSGTANGSVDVANGYGLITVADGIAIVLDECFTGETPVLVGVNKFAPISTLYPGDEVESLDPFGVPKREKIVSNIQSTTNLILTINGELRCTPTHPFYTKEGWVQAGNLNPSHVLISRTGSEIPVTHVHRTNHPEGVTVYNLHLPVLSSKVFFVGSLAVTVHNK